MHANISWMLLQLPSPALRIKHLISHLACEPRNLPGVTICTIGWILASGFGFTGLVVLAFLSKSGAPTCMNEWRIDVIEE